MGWQLEGVDYGDQVSVSFRGIHPGKCNAALPDHPNSGGLGDESPNAAPVPGKLKDPAESVPAP